MATCSQMFASTLRRVREGKEDAERSGTGRSSPKAIAVKWWRGNHYFPPESVDRRYLEPSDTHTVCPWKGTASYYHVVVRGQVNKDAAWYYPRPTEAARHIKDYVAFWRGVKIEV